MLAKSMLKMVSALTYKDIKELKSMLTPSGLTKCGKDIRELESMYTPNELESILTPAELEGMKRSNEWRDAVFDKVENVLDKLQALIDMLRASGRGVDRPIYSKALLKLNELQTALRVD